MSGGTFFFFDKKPIYNTFFYQCPEHQPVTPNHQVDAGPYLNALTLQICQERFNKCNTFNWYRFVYN